MKEITGGKTIHFTMHHFLHLLAQSRSSYQVFFLNRCKIFSLPCHTSDSTFPRRVSCRHQDQLLQIPERQTKVTCNGNTDERDARGIMHRYLHRKLQRGQDVFHFRLENFWTQFSFGDAHLVGEEHHLQEDGNKIPPTNTMRASIERVLESRNFQNFVRPCSLSSAS